jgi:hypothetical protein
MMMWYVVQYCGDSASVLGVFTTKELAEQFRVALETMPRHEGGWCSFDAYEAEVDPAVPPQSAFDDRDSPWFERVI